MNTKTTTEMKLVPLSKLVPYVNNARTHSPEQIVKLRSSLREFGFINPVIIDRDFGVIAGHGRILAAKEEGITEVPCVFADHLTEAQKKAYIIADNRMAMDAGWDEELLRLEIESLQAADFDPLLTGFDEKELADLFAEDKEAKDDGFDLTAALEKAAFVERGDRWHVGRHTLMCGDATEAADVGALMDGAVANLCCIDPPYGVSFKSWGGLEIQNDSLNETEFETFLSKAFENIRDHLAPGGAIYVFHADSLTEIFRTAFKRYFHLSAVCVWVKNSLVPGWGDYQYRHEPVLYGYLENAKHRYYGDRKQTTVWEFKKQTSCHDHPTSKPLDLMTYPLGNSSQENGVVIDTFGGSGSTLIACEQMNRICYMMDLDPKYASVILRRAVENGIDPEEVFVERNGEKIPYSALVKEVDRPDDE
ncbi:MAG: ParB N-terminal domain-containing protein [Oscillospiraceae bacterium]|nr:ParB N-terminal domain-containing protein [Oscillospiraceae bacterium]